MNNENIAENTVEQEGKKFAFFMGFIKKFLILFLIMLIAGGLLAGSCMIVFKNDSGDNAFKDNKAEWEKVTEKFETED